MCSGPTSIPTTVLGGKTTTPSPSRSMTVNVLPETKEGAAEKSMRHGGTRRTVIDVTISSSSDFSIQKIPSILDSKFKNGDLIPVFTVSWCDDSARPRRRFDVNSLLHLRDGQGYNAVPFFLFVVVESIQLRDYLRDLPRDEGGSNVVILCLDGSNLIPR